MLSLGTGNFGHISSFPYLCHLSGTEIRKFLKHLDLRNKVECPKELTDDEI